jgi:hypothetical protein
MACNGAPGEACGGSDRISLYERTAAPPAQSSAIEIDDGTDWVWIARGCYSDVPWMRILSQGVNVQGGGQNNSAQSCTAECRKQNFQYAGTEYAAECFVSSLTLTFFYSHTNSMFASVVTRSTMVTLPRMMVAT